MFYLISTFPLWLLLALGLGLAVGWLTTRPGSGGWRGVIPWLLVLGGGAIIAAFKLLPNRMGYWLDLGLLLLAAYLVGCCLAAFLRQSLSPKAELAAEPVRTMPPPLVSEPAVEPAKAANVPAIAEPVEEAITGLSGPRGGKGDDLTKIYGIDGEIAGKLNGLGLYHYDQLAQLTPGQRRWLFRQLGHEGRFPSWWWRWRYDAEQLVAAAGKTGKATGKAKAAAPVLPAEAPAEPEGTKPQGIAAARGGKADDLKRIRGIGKQNEGRLHGLGIWHFDQIAAWSAQEALWVGGYLAFPGRIEREDWIGQAKQLASGAETEFSKRVDAGEVESSRDDSNDDGQANVAVIGKEFDRKKAPKPKK